MPVLIGEGLHLEGGGGPLGPAPGEAAARGGGTWGGA
jgi:hypothetical protein